MKKLVLVISVFLVLFIPVSVRGEEVTKEVVTLSKCVDGDTAKFTLPSGETYTTRFLAVDTPETVHPTKKEEPFGKEASTYTCDSLTNAKVIELEYDPNSDKTDYYDRLLAWVFVDGELLQLKLIKEGLGEVAYLYADYKYTGLLQDEEVIAKNNKVGKWGTQKVVEKEVVSSSKKVKKEKSFFEQIFDHTIGFLIDAIGDFVDDIVKSLEDML